MARPYYRGCHCAVLTYDISNKDTFIDLSMWLVEVDACCDPFVKVLVGNKLDKEPRQVTREEGETFARQHGFDFFIETSAKTGASVENLFFDIAEQLILKYKDGEIQIEDVPNPDVIHLGSSLIEKKNSSCRC
jgi:GTPase SAR1 family protein